MVIPRSRSRSMASSTCSRISREDNPPVISMMRSASVDLPWSIWAIIQKFRRRSKGISDIIFGARSARSMLLALICFGPHMAPNPAFTTGKARLFTYVHGKRRVLFVGGIKQSKLSRKIFFVFMKHHVNSLPNKLRNRDPCFFVELFEQLILLFRNVNRGGYLLPGHDGGDAI